MSNHVNYAYTITIAKIVHFESSDTKNLSQSNILINILNLIEMH